MFDATEIDDAVVKRLPLPLAQCMRRALDGKNALDRALGAYFLWEAGLKLLGSVAIVTYVERDQPVPAITELLQDLTRPSLGHWWSFVRRLTPYLAEAGDDSFRQIRDLLFSAPRDSLPRAAGLFSAIAEHLDGRGNARNVVSLGELFDRLVQYRNRELGHGATGRQSEAFYETMSRTMLAGILEVFGQLDVLAGNRLVHVGDVRRQAGGDWLVERSELSGDFPRRLDSLVIPSGLSSLLPQPSRLYIERANQTDANGLPQLQSLHPLVLFQAESKDVFFLNARRGKQRVEYLCYRTGECIEENYSADHRRLLAAALNIPTSDQAPEVSGSTPAAEDVPQPENESAQCIGEYELISVLGRGGMGVVYRAWQPSLGRQVALKRILRLGDPVSDARFAREIRALGKIDHPNVVKALTSGSFGDQWFLVMELVEGTDLTSVCAQLDHNSAADVDETVWANALTSACNDSRSRETPLSRLASKERGAASALDSLSTRQAPSEIRLRGGIRTSKTYLRKIVEIVATIADATQAVNDAGIIHRDIKPANIRLTPHGHPILMDLGVAQLLDDERQRLTKTRQNVGTLRYMSPEQMLGVSKLDARTDVYSLGATLWELLTLQPLFNATNDVPEPEVMRRVQVSEPTSPCRLNATVPKDLEAIALKCLEKDRDRRYASASQVAVDLRNFLKGDPVLARRQTLWYRATKKVRKHPASLLSAAAVMLLAMLAWVAIADSGFNLPGGTTVRHWLDIRGASLFRQAPTKLQLATGAAVQRGTLEKGICDWLGSPTAPMNAAARASGSSVDAWTQSQLITAVFAAPQGDGVACTQRLDVLLSGLFESKQRLSHFVAGAGWPDANDGQPSAEANAWALSAIALADRRDTAPAQDADREHLRAWLELLQSALDNYRSRDVATAQLNGGWTLLPGQQSSAEANVYISTLVAQGLLNLRRADLPWHKSKETRDALLRETFEYLVRQFDGKGWVTPDGHKSEAFNDGLTLQIFSMLLDAENDGLIVLPDQIVKRIPLHLAECGDRSFDHPLDVAFFYPSVATRSGAEALTMVRPIKFLWHPWAIRCGVYWLRRIERTGGHGEESLRTRRVLGHLILALGDGAVTEAQAGAIWVVSETLIGLSSVDQLK